MAFAAFHARRWLGETVDVRVTQLQENEDGDHTRFEVTMRGEGGAAFSDEVSHGAFARLREGETVKARYVPSWSSASAIGPDVTAHSVAYAALPLLGVIALAYLARAQVTRPWYEKKLIEQGSGKLAESLSSPQQAPKRREGPPPGPRFWMTDGSSQQAPRVRRRSSRHRTCDPGVRL